MLAKNGHLCTTCCKVVHYICDTTTATCSKTTAAIGPNVYATKAECDEKCVQYESCTPYVLARKTTNALTDPTFDLTPYQGEAIVNTAGRIGYLWRLKEVGAGVVYANGDVSANGQLAGLPASFSSHFNYNGYMELQIGCEYTEPQWP